MQLDLPEIDDSQFRAMLDYLNSTRQPASQIIGFQNRRAHPPELSKRSWSDARLYHYVMKFALMNLPHDFKFTSAQLIRNGYKFDKSNKGLTYVVGFGNYTKGEFVLKMPHDTEFNIRHRPIIFDVSKTEYHARENDDTKWMIVFYSVSSKLIPVNSLSNYEAVIEGGKWCIAWYKNGEPTRYLSKKNGLPSLIQQKKEEEKFHFLVKVKKPKNEVAEIIDDERYSAAQNLMMRASSEYTGIAHGPIDEYRRKN